MITIHLGFLTAFMLALIRTTMFLIFCPPFSNRAFSGRIKAVLGAGLGLVRIQRIGPVTQTDSFMVECVIQAPIGPSVALMVQITLTTIQTADSLLDLGGGFTMMQASDPLTMTNQTTFGRVYELTAMTLLSTTNGCQLLIMNLTRFFTAMPPEMMFDMSNYVECLVYHFAELTMSVLEVAGSPLLVLFLTDMGMGLLTRMAPTMNAFTLGFPLKIMVTAFFTPAITVVLPQLAVKPVDVAVKSWMGVIL